MPDPQVAPVTIVLYDGSEQPVEQAMDVLLDIRNNMDVQRSVWVKGPVIQLNLQFHDGPGDNYIVNAWVKGYRGTGDFVTADPKVHPTLKFLLIPVPTKLTFRAWADLKAKYPKPAEFLAAAATAAVSDVGSKAIFRPSWAGFMPGVPAKRPKPGVLLGGPPGSTREQISALTP